MTENTKKVTLSQIKEDLLSGLTRWKKDDIGFGSLEKKYSLTVPEMVKLLAHPKIEKIETMIPTFIIVDDLENEEEVEEIQAPILETKIEVQQPAPQRIVEKRVEKRREEIQAFI